jgi:hypothetical protein
MRSVICSAALLLALFFASAPVYSQTTYKPYGATAGSYDSVTFYFSNVSYDGQLVAMRTSVQCIDATEYLTIYGNGTQASASAANSGQCNNWPTTETFNLNGMSVTLNPATWTVVRQCVTTRSGGTCYYKIYQYDVSIEVH